MSVASRLKRTAKVLLGLDAREVPEWELSGFNWDNCNPATNGEYFFVDNRAPLWKVCFDIGANVGGYASRVLRSNPACRVVCFEPNVRLVDEIRKAGIQEVYNCAVGDKDGTLSMNFDHQVPTRSSVHRKFEGAEAREVESVTIDGIMEKLGLERVDFIKIDTEGHELAVLLGGKRAFSGRRVDMVQFEYGGTYLDAGTTLGEVYEVLEKDYIICHMLPGGLLPVGYSKEAETYRYSNWVAVSRSLQL